jgi:V/A-type H+-transporting ATPase subunit E
VSLFKNFIGAVGISNKNKDKKSRFESLQIQLCGGGNRNTMGNEKIQGLIEVLKEHGVQSGEALGRQIVEKSHSQAEDILAKAKAEAEALVSKANREAEQTLRRLQSSLEIAAAQFVGNLKRVVEENLLNIPLKSRLTEELSNPEYLKELIAGFVKAYSADPQHSEVQILLPAGSTEELKNFAGEMIAQYYGKDQGEAMKMVLESQNVRFGFQIDRKDGKGRFDFSEEAFLALFLRFLTPGFRELFSGFKTGEAVRK